MFSKYANHYTAKIDTILSDNKVHFDEAIIKAESNEILGLEELAALLAARTIDEKMRVFDLASKITRKIHGQKVGLIAPLYIDNHCFNKCRYCGMSSLNKQLKRTRIENREQFIEEVSVLRRLGYYTIELVAGGIPIDIDELNDYIECMERFLIESIAFFFDTLDGSQYRTLASAHPGITMVHWQETYLRQSYVQYHPSDTPKGDYNRRVDAIETAIANGINKYAIGVQFGLADPFKDVLMCVAHGRYLHDSVGCMPRAIGLVRLQPTIGAEIIEMPVSVDEEMHRFFAAILRLAFPKADIIITSRERSHQIKEILRIAATFTNATCTTVPGGYSRYVKAGLQTDGQFFHESPTYVGVKQLVENVGLELDAQRPL